MQRWGVICKKCGKPAFVVLGDLPKTTDVIMAARCQHLDGRPMIGTAEEALTCDSCGADFTLSGVEPSTNWTLMPDFVAQPHNPQDMPFGKHADPIDIASVRLAISQVATPPKRRVMRRRRASTS